MQRPGVRVSFRSSLLNDRWEGRCILRKVLAERRTSLEAVHHTLEERPRMIAEEERHREFAEVRRRELGKEHRKHLAEVRHSCSPEERNLQQEGRLQILLAPEGWCTERMQRVADGRTC